MKKTIIVDGRVLSKPICGIGKYLFNVLKEFEQHPDIFNIEIYTNKPLNPIYHEIYGFSRVQIKECHNRIWNNSLLWFIVKFQHIILTKTGVIVWGPAAQLPWFIGRKNKSIITVHDLVHKDYKHTMSIKNRISNLLLTEKSILYADAFWCVSEYTKEKLLEYNPKLNNRPIMVGSSIDYNFFRSINLSPNECNKIRERYNVHSDEKMILFVGTLEPRKNLNFLLKLMPVLDRHKIKLIIVGGKGWKTTSIVTVINDINFPKNSTIFAGKIDDEELRRLYNVADALCMPSVNEGFGLPILEAVSCKCNVICADNSGMKEIDHNLIIRVKGWKEEDWVDAIIKAVSTCRPNDVRISNKYLWPNIMQSFYSLIKSLQAR